MSLLFSDWGISLFNLPDIILASRSVSHTDSGYIVRVRKHTHTQNLSHTLFPHLPMGYFLSTPTVPVTRHCCPNIRSPKAHSKADSMQDKAPRTCHRGSIRRQGQPLREAHFHFKHVLLQRNSQEKEQDPMSIGCLKVLFSEESNWALFGWAWSSSNSHRIYEKDIIRWEVYFY